MRARAVAIVDRQNNKHWGDEAAEGLGVLWNIGARRSQKSAMG